ncbi:MAG: hypothetical protein M3303_12975 [Gemmatimonadota bacterium]|nr:hypothetical protein [Gemmatimonadota bacterium]
MPPKIARLAGLGAFAACAGFALLYLLLVYLTRPTARGGIDSINAVVTWIALGGVFAALIGAHVLIGRRLLELARGAPRAP